MHINKTRVFIFSILASVSDLKTQYGLRIFFIYVFYCTNNKYGLFYNLQVSEITSIKTIYVCDIFSWCVSF